MRMIRLLGSVPVLLACLSSSVSFGQTAPSNAVPLVTQVSPPSLPPTSTAPGNGNFTLTILGANFPSTAVVNLTGPGNFTIHPSRTSYFREPEWFANYCPVYERRCCLAGDTFCDGH